MGADSDEEMKIYWRYTLDSLFHCAKNVLYKEDVRNSYKMSVLKSNNRFFLNTDQIC